MDTTPVSALLFDLDGTLVDTRRDITDSLNEALSRVGRPPRTIDEVTTFIGDGVRELFSKALGPGHLEHLDRCCDLFIRHYSQHCADHVILYPGVTDVLAHFSHKRLAMVTNKPEHHSRLILKALKLESFFPVLIGGDTLPERKPSPLPLLKAAEQLRVDPARTVMVGDNTGDISAARAAGMISCGLTYGYRSGHDLSLEKPDFLLDHLTELRRVLS